MAQPYIGEIRMFGGNFAPVGWWWCDGSSMPISENEALFQLIGTTYGGDGESNFNLPDLRGRVPVHMNTPQELAQAAGVEAVTLTVNQIPTHSHPLIASQAIGNSSNPAGEVPAQTAGGLMPYFEADPNVPMAPQAVQPIGGSQPHDNHQPYLCISFIISLFGIFPSPT